MELTMNRGRFPKLGSGLLLLLLAGHPVGLLAQSGGPATQGGLSGIFNLRLETVDQDNALQDAEALTLSSRIRYSTPDRAGFSAAIEIENVQGVGGIDDYSLGATGFNPGVYSTIADPEGTEIDEAFVQYRDDRFSAKVGRQIITYEDHRFIGHVGWRQDRQTFDAVTMTYTPAEDWSFAYNFIEKRNRIFANDADIDSSDHLLHAVTNTPLGELTGYAYLLEARQATTDSLDTVGLRLEGSEELGSRGFSYLVEYASQESASSRGEFDADYLRLELATGLVGDTNLRVGREVLGSDRGNFGFATPLATLHAFNGWSDSFLATPAAGLMDHYVSLGGQLRGGRWSLVYHRFDADRSQPGIDSFGSELDLQFTYPLSDNMLLGLKFADFRSGDLPGSYPETTKTWLWLTARF